MWMAGVHVHCLFWEEMASGFTEGRKQARGGSVMVWAMFCWKTLCSAIHVDVTLAHITYLDIVVDQEQPLMETIFPGGKGTTYLILGRWS